MLTGDELVRANLLLEILISHRNSPVLSIYHIYIRHQNFIFIKTICAFVYFRLKSSRFQCNSFMAIAHEMVSLLVYGEVKSYKEK